MENTNIVTKVVAEFIRDDNSEVRLVAELFYDRQLQPHTDFYVTRRENANAQWTFVDKTPKAGFKKMSRSEYMAHGRAEIFNLLTHGEILKALNMLGKPASASCQ